MHSSARFRQGIKEQVFKHRFFKVLLMPSQH
jgi:hypothetical protein